MISRLRFRSGVNLAFLQLITTTVTAGSAAPRGESIACNSSHTDAAFPRVLNRRAARDDFIFDDRGMSCGVIVVCSWKKPIGLDRYLPVRRGKRDRKSVV